MFLGKDTLDASIFHAEYWRKKPLIVRGAAEAFLGFTLSEVEFDDLAERLTKSNPDCVKRGGNGVTFVQNMDLVAPKLRAFSKRAREEYGWPHPWFDGVKSTEGSVGGIGCHYDDSDNFVFQLSGCKEWYLGSPNVIPNKELQRRMLRDPSAGTWTLPDDAIKFSLEAGDILYIPLFWIHYGVANGRSLSLSLVCNTTNAIVSLMSLMRTQLSVRDDWWQPIPRLRNGYPDKNANISHHVSAVHESAEEQFDRFWRTFEELEFRESIRQLWISHLQRNY